MTATTPPVTEPTAPPIPLTELPPGRCATVTAVEAPGAIADRLAALGLCLGRRVEVVRQGDPMTVRVCGARIGLAGQAARRVTVDPCNLACDASTPLTISAP